MAFPRFEQDEYVFNDLSIYAIVATNTVDLGIEAKRLNANANADAHPAEAS